MDLIRTYVFYLQGISSLLSFLFSLLLINNNHIPVYMRRFYYYPFVSIIVGIPVYLKLNFPLGFVFGLNNISLLFHFSFLSLFIINLLKKNIRKLLKIVFVFFLVLIIYGILKSDITEPMHQVFAVSSFGLTTFCLFYFYELFNLTPSFNLLEEPSFWIISGIFFAMSLSIPISVFLPYIKANLQKPYFIIFAEIIMFCYIIMHMFFIIGFICTVSKRKANKISYA